MLTKVRGWTIVITIASILIITMLSPSEVLAHRLVVEHEQQKGEIQVRYDDGSSSATAEITAYDATGQVVLEGFVTEDGLFVYDSAISIHRIIADDGMGHRAGWTAGEQSEWLLIPIWLRASLGISVLLFIAALFYYRSIIKR